MLGRTLIVFAVAVLVPAMASAHALLEHAVPAVGASVSQPPKQLRLWYSEKLDTAFTRVRVTDAHGQSVTAGAPHLAAGHPKELVVALKPLSPGTYHVRWRAVSVDTHVTQGDFTFMVGQ